MTARLDRTNAVHHVYRCFDSEGRLIYVGSSADLFGRLRTHRTSSWWAPQVAKVVAKVYANGVLARMAEREAIQVEMPRWNKAGKWQSRNRWTRGDWDDWLTVLLQQARFPTNELYARIRDYHALWNCEPPAAVLSQLSFMEAEHARFRAQMAEERAEHEKRTAEVRRQDELAVAREHRPRKAS